MHRKANKSLLQSNKQTWESNLPTKTNLQTYMCSKHTSLTGTCSFFQPKCNATRITPQVMTAVHLPLKKQVFEAVCHENVGLIDGCYDWWCKSCVHIPETTLLKAKLPIWLGTFVLVELIFFLHFSCFNMLFCRCVEFSQWIWCFFSLADRAGDVTGLWMYTDWMLHGSRLVVWPGCSVNSAVSVSTTYTVLFNIIIMCDYLWYILKEILCARYIIPDKME